MLFSSSTFLFLFLPISVVVYYTLLKNSRKWQNIFLFIISLFFYAWGEPSFALVMLLSIVSNYFFGIMVSRHNRKRLFLILSVIYNISVLFVFKYMAFTIENLNMLLGTSISAPVIALPLGISFFTFQGMSYVIDVYRGDKLQESVLNVGLYIAFFPQLIAGPIVRYNTVAYQIDNRKENMSLFSDGVCRFIMGLGKKVLLSNTLAVVADAAFDYQGELSVAFAWLGAIAYTFQIFFDFGGYSDMAIGLGKMFGFEFMENFDYPYISSSITEFWRRWHISLGSWFRDYVYFPLGGSRVKKKSRHIFNLFVVWLLTGIWHGANFTFLFWGLMYFVLLVIEKMTNFPKVKKMLPLKHIYTLLFVILGWVLFRAENVSSAINYIGAMFGSSGIIIDDNAVFLFQENAVFFVLGTIFSTPVIKNTFIRKSENNTIVQLILLIILFMIFMISAVYIVKGTYNPFIYFNF